MEQALQTSLPIPIYRVAHRYYIYDLDHATYLRHIHRIPGVLIGTLPQSPQQNVFSGLPVQLLPEEVRLLLEKRACYVVDDVAAHRAGIRGINSDGVRRVEHIARLRDAGKQVSLGREQAARLKTEQAMRRMDGDARESTLRALERRRLPGSHSVEDTPSPAPAGSGPSTDETGVVEAEANASLFVDSPDSQKLRSAPQPVHGITPTTSTAVLPPPSAEYSITDPAEIRETPATAYALYRYLHSQHPGSTYFLSPGLRFGCNYLVYPGDPLRFHSHFLAVGRGWDEEIDLLTLVGGGRLGTGVKKGFLLGGAQPAQDDAVRCFCIEWGGM